VGQVRGLGAIAVRNLRRRPFRTLSLLLSIALLATLVIFSLSSLLRLGQGIQLTLRRMGGDIMVAPHGAVTNPEEFLFATDKLSLHLKRDTLARLREMPAVGKVTAHTYLATLAGVCCSISSARIVAFDPETDFVITPWIERQLKRKLGKDEVVLGGKVEGISSIEMSRETWLLGMKFNVAATLDVTGTPLDNTVFIREADVREAIEKKLTPYVVSPDEVSVIFVSLRRGFDPDTVAKTIERENLEVKAITRGEIGNRLTRFFRVTLQIFLLTVIVGSTLALLVVASVFSAVANERTREVGILRALGATRGHVIRLFLAEAVATGLIGGLIGIAAGAALSVPAVRAVDEVTRFPVYFSPLVLLAIGAGGLGAAVGVAVIGALQPVLRVSRIDPLDAIKDTGEAPSACPAGLPEACPPPAESVLVRVRELEKHYPGADGQVAAIEGLSLEIRRGEFLAILGHSGSGKTTLLSLIGGLTRPTRGEVLLDGEDVARLDEARLAAVRNRSIGFIFQFASLVPTLTALENVLLPAAFSPAPPSGIEEEGRRLLGLVGLADKLNAYAGQLSGGQQRRVAIARAFILNPKLILADEPTGDLDVETEEEVMGLFRELHRRGVTIAMVTHEREITKDADRIVTMDRGRIV
jgi:ABC-type lipoprotein export system ATPase subunit/ABC-type lipoprotein release transport system permease subunit